jgi:hypothetical protein
VGAKAPVQEFTVYDEIVLFPVNTNASSGLDEGTQEGVGVGTVDFTGELPPQPAATSSRENIAARKLSGFMLPPGHQTNPQATRTYSTSAECQTPYEYR